MSNPISETGLLQAHRLWRQCALPLEQTRVMLTPMYLHHGRVNRYKYSESVGLYEALK